MNKLGILYNEKYRVYSTEYGRIYKDVNGELVELNQYDTNGYRQVSISGTKVYVHRLVFNTFNPEVDIDSLDVDHIDNKKSNNNINNLQAITHYENLHRRPKTNDKRIINIQTGKEFKSLTEASTWLISQGIAKAKIDSIKGCINRSANHGYKSYGFNWEYKG